MNEMIMRASSFDYLFLRDTEAYCAALHLIRNKGAYRLPSN